MNSVSAGRTIPAIRQEGAGQWHARNWRTLAASTAGAQEAISDARRQMESSAFGLAGQKAEKGAIQPVVAVTTDNTPPRMQDPSASLLAG